MALVYGKHLSWGDQDPGQQRCWNDLLPSMQMRPTLLSGPGNWKGVLAPPACGQGCRLTALPMDGNSRADWCSCSTIAVLCMDVSSGLEEAGQPAGLPSVFVTTSGGTHL